MRCLKNHWRTYRMHMKVLQCDGRTCMRTVVCPSINIMISDGCIIRSKKEFEKSDSCGLQRSGFFPSGILEDCYHLFGVNQI